MAEAEVQTSHLQWVTLQDFYSFVGGMILNFLRGFTVFLQSYKDSKIFWGRITLDTLPTFFFKILKWQLPQPLGEL